MGTPSTTRIIGDSLGWGKDDLIAWANAVGMKGRDYRVVRDSAGRAGTAAHSYIEHELKSGVAPRYPALDEAESAQADTCFLSFRKWLQQGSKIRPLRLELLLKSDKYNYTGRIDFYGEIDGELVALDFKTGGSGVSNESFIQLAAYTQLLLENGFKVDKMAVLWLGKYSVSFDYKDKPAVLENNPFWRVFEACLTIYNAKEEVKSS